MLPTTMLTAKRTMEMLPWQLVQQPGVAAVMLLDYNGCQKTMSDGDVWKQMLMAACSNSKRRGLNIVHYLLLRRKVK